MTRSRFPVLVLIASAALSLSSTALACRVPSNWAAIIASKYEAGAGNSDTRRQRVIESVALVRVLDAAPLAQPTSLDFWVATGVVERTLSGKTRAGKIGIGQQMISSCGPSFDMPITGQRWIVYFERSPNAPQPAIWTTVYPVAFAVQVDPRVRDALARPAGRVIGAVR